jgi:hypothetical protein
MQFIKKQDPELYTAMHSELKRQSELEQKNR